MVVEVVGGKVGEGGRGESEGVESEGVESDVGIDKSISRGQICIVGFFICGYKAEYPITKQVETITSNLPSHPTCAKICLFHPTNSSPSFASLSIYLCFPTISLALSNNLIKSSYLFSTLSLRSFVSLSNFFSERQHRGGYSSRRTSRDKSLIVWRSSSTESR